MKKEPELEEYVRDPSPYNGYLSRATVRTKIATGEHAPGYKFGSKLTLYKKRELIAMQQARLAEAEALSAASKETMAKLTAIRREKRAQASPASPVKMRRAA